MTCREAIDFLMSYLEGELSPEVRAEFEHHLSICPGCSTYLATYQQTVALSKSSLSEEAKADLPEMPEELVQAMLAALGHK